MAVTAEQTNLFLLEDLDDVRRTAQLAKSDLHALHTVAGWITSFVARPNKELGRAGPVCPFVPGALDRKALWLAPEPLASRSATDVVQLVDGYKELLLHAQPVDGHDATYKSIVIVFTDLSADRAKDLFGDVLDRLGVPSYAEDGVVLGGFYESNEGTAIYNAGFRPFTAPVPFLLLRPAVVGDWKFFVDDDNWLNVWARRFRETGAQALGEELRHLPWRVGQANRVVRGVTPDVQ